MGIFSRGGLDDIINPGAARKRNKTEDDIRQYLDQAYAARRAAAEFGLTIDRESRDNFDTNIAPIQAQLSTQLQDSLNRPDAEVAADAVTDVNSAFKRSTNTTSRNLARYGLTPSAADNNRLALARSRTSVNASNKAVLDARNNNITNAAKFYSLGMGIPGQAAALGQSAGAAGADINQTTGDEKIQKVSEDFGSLFRDGGKVPVKTRPGETIRLRNEYSKYVSDMEGNHKPWAEWLHEQGYVLKQDQLVDKKPEEKQYKDGGKVKSIRSGSFIMPADVVRKFGKPFFDNMVKTGKMPVMMADGGGINHTGSYLSSVLEGFGRGFQNREDRRMKIESHDLNMQTGKENLAFTKEQRARMLKQQGIEDEYNSFVRDHTKAMGQFAATGDAKPIADLFYKTTGLGMDVQTDGEGKYLVSIVDQSGGETPPPKVMSYDELGQQAMAMKDPTSFFKARAEAAKPKKGLYAAGRYGVTNTATGTMQPYPPGTVKTGDVKPSNAAKVKQELIASGTPEQLANAIAYKLVQKVQNPLGMGAVWVNTSTGQKVASMDESGNYKLEQGWADLQRQRESTPKADEYFKTLRAHPRNAGVSDDELRAYVQQRMGASNLSGGADETDDEEDYRHGGLVTSRKLPQMKGITNINRRTGIRYDASVPEQE